MTKSEKLLRGGKKNPGGVNSPVRAYGAIGKHQDLLNVQRLLYL